MRKFLILLIACITGQSFSQNKDSLWKVYNNQSQADTIRLKALHAIVTMYRDNDPDTAIILAEQELKLAQTSKQRKYEGSAVNFIGFAYMNKGNYPKALEYYLKALKIREEIGDKKGMGACYGNMGIVYQNQSNYLKALEYYLKSLQLRKESGDKNGEGNCYNNIGTAYKELFNYPKALVYDFKALQIYEEIANKVGVGNCYNNIGIVYRQQSNYAKALEYHTKALRMGEEIDDKRLVGLSYGNLGNLYNKLPDYALAIQYSNLELNLCKQIGDVEGEREAYENLAMAYSKTGKYKEAYQSHVSFKTFTDSIFNADNSKQLGDLKTQFEVEKKEAELKLKAEAQQVINMEEKKRQQFIIYAVAGMLLIVFVFSIFLFRRFKITQKQKHIISLQKDEVFRQKTIVEEQKHQVEEHQKEIIDSINYAKRIQYALLASEDLLRKYLPGHFVLFNPKDIVSGDFYWATEYKSNFYLAVCDSTGHGVPGAFMSILNIGFLSEAIKEKDITKPNEILNYVRTRLVETISTEGQKDGMDCILIRLELSSMVEKGMMRFEYAAANNEPILLRDGKITELAKDKMPVGKGEKTDSFASHVIELQKGDSLILYTDGYADQFGGPRGKKFKYKPLNELLLANQYKKNSEQQDVLQNTFNTWKGDLEQVDDVTIIGIRV